MWGFLLRDTIEGTLLEMSNFVDIVFGNGRILLSVSFDYTTDDGNIGSRNDNSHGRPNFDPGRRTKSFTTVEKATLNSVLVKLQSLVVKCCR